jgi:hypothetical protein
MGLSFTIAAGPRQRTHSEITVKYITNITFSCILVIRQNKSLTVTSRYICSGIHGYERFLELHVCIALSLEVTEEILLYYINKIMKDS